MKILSLIKNRSYSKKKVDVTFQRPVFKKSPDPNKETLILERDKDGSPLMETVTAKATLTGAKRDALLAPLTTAATAAAITGGLAAIPATFFGVSVTALGTFFNALSIGPGFAPAWGAAAALVAGGAAVGGAIGLAVGLVKGARLFFSSNMIGTQTKSLIKSYDGTNKIKSERPGAFVKVEMEGDSKDPIIEWQEPAVVSLKRGDPKTKPIAVREARLEVTGTQPVS